MFFSHVPEMIAILAVALVVFGPKRLPQIGSSLGQSIKQFKQGLSDSHTKTGSRAPLAERVDD